MRELLINFYKQLKESVLITLDFNTENKENLYKINSNYKVIEKNINAKLSGYSLNNTIIYKKNNNIIIEEINENNKDYIKEKIELAFENNTLYGVPTYFTDSTKQIDKALFLDRDGVINKDTGYIDSIDRIILIEDFFGVVRKANKKGYKVIVTTNQSGISYGYYSEETLNDIHNFIKEEYRKRNCIIDDFYYCPYHIKGNIDKYKLETVLRKPDAGMHLLASKKYNIDLSKSIMIGDRDSDIIQIPFLKTYLIQTENYEIENKKNIINNIKEIYNYL